MGNYLLVYFDESCWVEAGLRVKYQNSVIKKAFVFLKSLTRFTAAVFILTCVCFVPPSLYIYLYIDIDRYRAGFKSPLKIGIH